MVQVMACKRAQKPLIESITQTAVRSNSGPPKKEPRRQALLSNFTEQELVERPRHRVCVFRTPSLIPSI